jgi:hypothetical protein
MATMFDGMTTEGEEGGVNSAWIVACAGGTVAQRYCSTRAVMVVAAGEGAAKKSGGG